MALRDGSIQTAFESLAQCREIVDYLRKAKENAAELSAQQFAQAFKGAFKL